MKLSKNGSRTEAYKSFYWRVRNQKVKKWCLSVDEITTVEYKVES